MINGLPYAVRLSRGATDFCGDIGVDFAYDESDLQDGVESYSKMVDLIVAYRTKERAAIICH